MPTEENLSCPPSILPLFLLNYSKQQMGILDPNICELSAEVFLVCLNYFKLITRFGNSHVLKILLYGDTWDRLLGVW